MLTERNKNTGIAVFIVARFSVIYKKTRVYGALSICLGYKWDGSIGNTTMDISLQADVMSLYSITHQTPNLFMWYIVDVEGECDASQNAKI